VREWETCCEEAGAFTVRELEAYTVRELEPLL